MSNSPVLLLLSKILNNIYYAKTVDPVWLYLLSISAVNLPKSKLKQYLSNRQQKFWVYNFVSVIWDSVGHIKLKQNCYISHKKRHFLHNIIRLLTVLFIVQIIWKYKLIFAQLFWAKQVHILGFKGEIPKCAFRHFVLLSQKKHNQNKLSLLSVMTAPHFWCLTPHIFCHILEHSSRKHI